MTKTELLEILKKIAKEGDIEYGHEEADEALISFIGDAEIKEAYNAIDKWYS